MQEINIECQNPEHVKLLEEIFSLQNQLKNINESKLMSPKNQQEYQNHKAEIDQINSENMRAPNNSRLNYSNSEEKIAASNYFGSSIEIEKNNIHNSKTYPHSILVSPPKSEELKKSYKNVSFAEDDKVKINSGESSISNKNHSNDSQNSYKRKIEEMRQSIKEIHKEIQKKEQKNKIKQRNSSKKKENEKISVQNNNKNKNLKLDLDDNMNVNITINPFNEKSKFNSKNNINQQNTSNVKSISSTEKDKINQSNYLNSDTNNQFSNRMEFLMRENNNLKNQLNDLKKELSKILIIQNSQIKLKEDASINISNSEKYFLLEFIIPKEKMKKIILEKCIQKNQRP